MVTNGLDLFAGRFLAKTKISNFSCAVVKMHLFKGNEIIFNHAIDSILK